MEVRQKHRIKETTVPVIAAVHLPDPSVLRHMLLNGVDPYVDRVVSSPLHIVAGIGNVEAAESLLIAGTDPNVPDQDGARPLHVAIQRGDSEMVRLLLNHGADPGLTDRYNNSALHVAARLGHLQLVKALLKAGADVTQVGESGALPIHVAARAGQVHLVQLLCAGNPAMVNSKVPCYTNNVTQAPIHLAAENGHVETVSALLDLFGADVVSRDSAGNTALHRVVLRNHRPNTMRDMNSFCATAEVLIRYRVDIDKRNNHGELATSLADANGFPKIVQMLLATKAESDSPPSKQAPNGYKELQDHGKLDDLNDPSKGQQNSRSVENGIEALPKAPSAPINYGPQPVSLPKKGEKVRPHKSFGKINSNRKDPLREVIIEEDFTKEVKEHPRSGNRRTGGMDDVPFIDESFDDGYGVTNPWVINEKKGPPLPIIEQEVNSDSAADVPSSPLIKPLHIETDIDAEVDAEFGTDIDAEFEGDLNHEDRAAATQQQHPSFPNLVTDLDSSYDEPAKAPHGSGKITTESHSEDQKLSDEEESEEERIFKQQVLEVPKKVVPQKPAIAPKPAMVHQNVPKFVDHGMKPNENGIDVLNSKPKKKKVPTATLR